MSEYKDMDTTTDISLELACDNCDISMEEGETFTYVQPYANEPSSWYCDDCMNELVRR